MKSDPADLSLKAYLQRALAVAAVGLVLVLLIDPIGQLLFARPTAGLLRLLLTASGNEVQGTGAQIQVGTLPLRLVPTAWTAAPAFLLGLGAVAAYPAGLAKRAVGVTMVLINCVMVNAMVLGWLLMQSSVVVDAAGTVTVSEQVTGALRWVYPPVMTGVLVVSLLFWYQRVVPRPLLGGRSAVAGE